MVGVVESTVITGTKTAEMREEYQCVQSYSISTVYLCLVAKMCKTKKTNIIELISLSINFT